MKVRTLRMVIMLGLAFLSAACEPHPSPPAPPPPVALPPVSLDDEMRLAAEDAVRGKLRDPDSARFGSVTAFQKAPAIFVVCGDVNARNGFGGYAGASPFFAQLYKSPEGYQAFAMIAGSSPEERAIFSVAAPFCH